MNEATQHELLATDLRPFRFLGQFERLLLECFHAAERRSDHDADTVWIDQRVRRVPHAAIFEGLSGRGHGEMGESIVRLDILGIDEMVFGDKVEYFAGDLTREEGRIEPLDATQTGFTGHAGVKEVIRSQATATHDAEACYHHPL